MKKLRQILAVLLVISMAIPLYGCNKDTETTGGLKIISGKHLVEDGKSEYTIVIPEDAEDLIDIAADEFNKFFSESTDLTLPIVTDKDVDGNGKYISIGETTLLGSTDIQYDYSELGRDGYKIITRGDIIYLIGGGDYGTLYAVYGILSYLVDYDFFYKDCYTVQKGVTEIPLYDFDITDVPDIATRTSSDGVIGSDAYTLYRMRVRPYEEDFVSVGSWVHNAFNYVENDERVNATWYNDEKTQLCYTTHGNEDEYNNMLDASFQTMKAALMKEPEKTTISFTNMDNRDICKCDACQEMVDEYGAISATCILFLNDLSEVVKEWFETEEGKPYARDLKIFFFAYSSYEAVPATYNEETQKYELNNGLTIDDNVYCFLAPIFVDYYRGISSKINQDYYNNVKAWGDVTGHSLALWYYSTNFSDYMTIYDTFNGMQENYQFAVENGATYLFDQRSHNEYSFVTGWSNLKSYLSSKLAWDAEADVPTLIDKFFEGYFGPAADDMRSFYDEMRTLTEYNIENNELSELRSIYKKVSVETYWPKDVLKGWLSYCESAEEKIASLKEKNPSQYEMYHEHINGEKLSVLYLFVECYSYNTSEDVIDAYKAEFKDIATTLNISLYSESVDISELYSRWGID